jgi:4'-phosphopantetheinyl transferase
VTILNFVYYRQPLPTEVFNKKLSDLPSPIVDKISAFRKWQDAHASLFGLLLLRKGLAQFNIKLDPATITKTSFGRPMIGHDIDFNISHAGECVVCVISDDTVVGVDVEEVNNIDLTAFKSYFVREWPQIQSSVDRFKTFYQLWTQKEAVIKADGRGLSAPVETLTMIDTQCILGEHTYYLQELDLKNERYIAHLATRKMFIDLCYAQFYPHEL